MPIGISAIGRLAIGATVSGASAGSITLTTPVDGRIHQRSGTTGTITVTGTYTGTPATIEARLVEDGTSTPLTGFDWAVKDATPSGSAFSFSFSSVPQDGNWYNVQVRFSDATTVNDTSGKVGVGYLIAVTGQSNGARWFKLHTTALTPNAKVRVYGNTITGWAVPTQATMSGAIAFGNALATTTGSLIGVLDYAVSGEYLHNYASNSWLPTTNASYTAFKAGAITALDGKLEAIIFIEGESDALQSASQAQYYADQGTLFAAMRSDTGQALLPIVNVGLGRWLAGSMTDAAAQNVRLAIAQKNLDANMYGVERVDIPIGVDNMHHTDAGFETLGTRCAQVASYITGDVTYYRGPQISSVTQVSTSIYDVNLTHNSSATDFTPTSGITGFRVLVSGSPVTISSVAQQSSTKVRITLASPAGSLPTVQHLYGYGPTITGVVKDNTSLTLPLEFNGGVVAQAGNNESLNAAAFDFAVNDAQILNTLNLSAAAFDFVAQDLADHQMLLHLGAGTFNFVAKSIRAGDPLAGSGRATNLMLMGVGN